MTLEALSVVTRLMCKYDNDKCNDVKVFVNDV